MDIKQELKKIINTLEKDKSRVVMLCEQVTNKSAERVTKELLELDDKSHEDITLIINSPGGCVHSGFQIMDTMNLIKSDVITINTGMAASMGFMILINGAKGKRFSYKHAQAMAHQVSSGTYGHIVDQEIRLAHTRNLNEIIIKMISEKIKMPISKVRKFIDRDQWMSAEKAKQLKVIDKIL